MNWNGLPIVIFGYGGISKEVYCLVKDLNKSNPQQIFEFLGFIGNDIDMVGTKIIDNYTVISNDKDIFEFIAKYPLIGMIIPIGTPAIKKSIFQKVMNTPNVVFPNLIHPSVVYEPENISLGVGNIITSGVKLTCDIKIGNFNLFNLNSTIGHDTEIGDFNVINPLVAVSGNVILNDSCLIGTGAQILQGLRVNSNSTVGAGAVVVKDVESNTTVVGIPAKPLMKA